MLLDSPLESYPLEANIELPSPSLLKKKIIIKNKKKHYHYKKSDNGATENRTQNVSNYGKECLDKVLGSTLDYYYKNIIIYFKGNVESNGKNSMEASSIRCKSHEETKLVVNYASYLQVHFSNT